MIKKSLILFIVLFHFTSPAQATLPPEIKSLMKMSYTENKEKDFLMIITLLEKSNPELILDIRNYITQLKTNNLLKSDNLNIAADTPDLDITEDAAEEKNPWSGEAEMNILLTNGKKSIEYYGLKGKIKKDIGNFHHLLEAYFDLNKTDHIKNEEKTGLAYKIDFDINEASYLLSLATYETDEFGPFRERITTSIGIGYHLFNNQHVEWKLEGGPSYIMTTNHTVSSAPPPERLDEFSARASSIFAWNLSEHTKFTNNLVILAGKRNLIEAKSSLKFKILGALHSKFSYDILYDKDAPIGSKKTNTVFRTGLLFEF